MTKQVKKQTAKNIIYLYEGSTGGSGLYIDFRKVIRNCDDPTKQYVRCYADGNEPCSQKYCIFQ